MGHRGAGRGYKDKREAVEKGSSNLLQLCFLYFALAPCTLYFALCTVYFALSILFFTLCTLKKVSPICCHFAPTPFKAGCGATPL